MAEHKHAAVLRAIADGKDVQWKSCDFGGDWQDFYSAGMITPLTHWRHEWRIKPEPKPDVVRYVPIFSSSGWDEEDVARKETSTHPRFSGVVRTVIDGEGKLKSAEVLP